MSPDVAPQLTAIFGEAEPGTIFSKPEPVGDSLMFTASAWERAGGFGFGSGYGTAEGEPSGGSGGGGGDAEALEQRGKDIAKKNEEIDAQINELLGDEQFAIYEEYMETQPERMQVHLFKQQLVAANETLSEEQEHELILALGQQALWAILLGAA